MEILQMTSFQSQEVGHSQLTLRYEKSISNLELHVSLPSHLPFIQEIVVKDYYKVSLYSLQFQFFLPEISVVVVKLTAVAE